MGDSLRESYNKKIAQYLVNEFDVDVAEIISKELNSLTEDDLESIGFQKTQHEEIEDLYAFEDLTHLKIYVNRIGNKFELRGLMLRKEKDIYTTNELLEETLLKWKLKINP